MEDGAEMEEIWVEHGEARLCALINGSRGWLMYLRYPGDEGSHSVDPDCQDPGEMEFLLNNGQLDRYPVAWTLPIETVRQALEHFEQTGQPAPFVPWEI